MAAIQDRSPLAARVTTRQLVVLGVSSAALVAGLVVIAPALAGLPDVWRRIAHGDPWWLAFALFLEAMSFVGHIVLFRAVSLDGTGRIGMRASTEITLAGHMATRLFASAGAGGIALTAWALRRSGMERRLVAVRLIAFTALLYAVYMAALVIFGFGLYFGILKGGGPFGVTVVPAVFALLLWGVFVGVTLLPGDAERRIEHWAQGSGSFAKLMARAVTVPASGAEGVRLAFRMAADREFGLLGAVAWWGFDICTLWACFHAYSPGNPPPFAVIVMAYFVGMLANTLPLPGGIGGVDGGMIGAFIAFDVSGSYATVAVLTYRAFAFWLPTIPGAVAYFQLRRTVAGWRQERGGPAEAAVAGA
jgi:uncharacterized protein (TIRG00374 family)